MCRACEVRTAECARARLASTVAPAGAGIAHCSPRSARTSPPCAPSSLVIITRVSAIMCARACVCVYALVKKTVHFMRARSEPSVSRLVAGGCWPVAGGGWCVQRPGAHARTRSRGPRINTLRLRRGGACSGAVLHAARLQPTAAAAAESIKRTLID